MNNNFDRLAVQFLNSNAHMAEAWTDEELDFEIRSFLSNRGIDEAWMDEAVEVVREHFEEWN